MQVLVAKERLAREELQNRIEHLEKSLTEKEAQSHGNRLNKSEDESKISSGGNLCKIYVKGYMGEALRSTVPPRNNLALRLPASGPRPARVLRLLCPRLARKAPAFGPHLARVCVQATRGHPHLASGKLDAVSVVYSGKRTIS